MAIHSKGVQQITDDLMKHAMDGIKAEDIMKHARDGLSYGGLYFKIPDAWTLDSDTVRKHRDTGPHVQSRVVAKVTPAVPCPKDMFPVIVQVTAELGKHGLGGGRIAKQVGACVEAMRQNKPMKATDLLDVTCTYKDLGVMINITTDAYCSKCIVQVALAEDTPIGDFPAFKGYSYDEFEAHQAVVPTTGRR